MRDALSALLIEHQFDPIPMATIAEFSEVQQSIDLDLILIDLRLRDESGLELTRHIRHTQNVPIVMLTASGDETDKIVCLEVGADDFLFKPFNPRELIARIRAVLRRYGAGAQVAHAQNDTDFAFGNMTLDQVRKSLFDAANSEISLTNAEFQLLSFFLERPNKVISRVDLLAGLHSDLSTYVDRTIDVLILRLRRKIEENPSKPTYLQTRRGQGYVFVTRTQEIAL